MGPNKATILREVWQSLNSIESTKGKINKISLAIELWEYFANPKIQWFFDEYGKFKSTVLAKWPEMRRNFTLSTEALAGIAYNLRISPDDLREVPQEILDMGAVDMENETLLTHLRSISQEKQGRILLALETRHNGSKCFQKEKETMRSFNIKAIRREFRKGNEPTATIAQRVEMVKALCDHPSWDAISATYRDLEEHLNYYGIAYALRYGEAPFPIMEIEPSALKQIVSTYGDCFASTFDTKEMKTLIKRMRQTGARCDRITLAEKNKEALQGLLSSAAADPSHYSMIVSFFYEMFGPTFLQSTLLVPREWWEDEKAKYERIYKALKDVVKQCSCGCCYDEEECS